MSSDYHFGGGSEPDPLRNVPTECYDVFRHPRRLRILEILGTYRTRLSLTELTTEIIDREEPDVPAGQARYEIRTNLVHNHLPRLADHGIVTFDTESGVELADQPPVHPTELSGLLELCNSEACEDLLEAIVHPVRLRIVSMIAETNRPLSLERLAAELVDCDAGSFSDPERAAISLHHTHLPMLADVGVLEFDADSGQIVPDERPMSIPQ